jgi:threonine dehydrogenase-like Zn-dependent dehydrogenase
MIAATYTDGGAFGVEDVPQPEIGEDELLVEVKASSICGTDLRIIRNGHRKLRKGQKIVLGHEFAGVIVQAGRRLDGYEEGQRVGIAPNMGCGKCDVCARGLPNMCPDYTAFGVTMDGSHTELVRVPRAAVAQGSVISLPEEVPFHQACLIEPFSCVVSGCRAVRIEPGDAAVVLGAGPIGLMHVMLASLSGVRALICVDVVPQRLRLAEQFGATYTINAQEADVKQRVLDETQGRGADVAITACSVAKVQQQALGLLAPFGRLCLFGGLPKDGSQVSFDTNLIHYRQLTVTGTTGGAPRDFRAALSLVATGRAPIEQVISHRFSASEMAKAFDTALAGDAMKVVIEPGMSN